MRTYGFPADVGKPLSLFGDDAPLKAHALYRWAKAGDAEAAVKLVVDLARPLAEQAPARYRPDTIYVAPHALEQRATTPSPEHSPRPSPMWREARRTMRSCRRPACSTPALIRWRD